MPEELIIKHCSPTLAGLKTANLFTCTYDDKPQVLKSIRQLNRQLGPKGVRVLPLRYTQNRALIYLYRPSKLQRDLKDEIASHILQACGYQHTCPKRCLVTLMDRLQTEEEFPHEIGLFLGYPSEDVAGFMKQGARSCKCSGCWKVYGDETHARKCFEQYIKCTKIYENKWSEGKSVAALTVKTH